MIQDNYLINGGFDFAQRQTPGTLTAPTQTSGSAADTTHDGYGADRWKASFQTATLQFSRTDTNGALETGITARYYGNWKQITSSGKFVAYQILEGINTLPLASQQLVFQVKMKASSAKTIRIAVLQLNASGTIDTVPNPLVSAWGANSTDPTWGTNVAVVGNVTQCSVTTSWQNFYVNVQAPGTAKNLIVAIWTDSQFSANDILSTTEAGLYLSSTAISTWGPRPVEMEVALCQRYYAKSYDIETIPGTAIVAGSVDFRAIDTSNLWGSARFPVNMRNTPSITLYSAASGTAGTVRRTSNGTSVTLNANNHFNTCVIVSPTSAAGFVSGETYDAHFSADAEL